MARDHAPSSPGRLAAAAHWAEIVASVAVVVTLLFLVREVRQNTEAVRSESYSRIMDQMNAWRLAVSSDDELAELWDQLQAALEEGGELPNDRRLEMFMTAQWGIYENAYYSNQRGFLGPSEWSRFQRMICTNRDAAWSLGIAARLTEEFVSFVGESCGSGGSSATERGSQPHG